MASESPEATPLPADEHTRLLPNRVSSSVPYLHPHDPAVSPYNLWSVRFMKGFTIFFTILTFLWWILLLVSIFLTPPGFHIRGSGFFAFSYANIALFTLIFTLMFFGAPSKGVRVLSVFLALILALDGILLLAVEKNRIEEGWVGITSVFWALLMSLWALLCDRTVEWGKAEEEQRLTGRVEMARTFGEWTQVVVSTIAMAVLSAVVILMTMTIILRSLDAGLAPIGKQYWVDGNKYRIHVYCDGESSTGENGKTLPTVLFEGGEEPVENGLWQLAQDAQRNGSIGRYCFADRPGYAWSDTAPSPLAAGMAEDALSQALALAGEEGPWILVSAGTGSLYSRVFSSRHGAEVAGLLLIDPLHEDLLGRLGSPTRGFLLWLRGVLSPLGLDRVPGALFRQRSSADRVWGRAAYQSGKYIFARLQESISANSLTKRDVASSRTIQRPETPLVLVTSGEQLRRDAEWEAKQRDLSALTQNLKHWDIVGGASHRVWRSLEGRQIIEKRLRQLVHA